MDRVKEHGFRLLPDKSQFYLRSVKYLGFIFHSFGWRPNPENIQAIKKMPAPPDLLTLRSFLGLISHYSAFLPFLHEMRTPLNHLLKKNTEWKWTKQCQTAFEELKARLGYYFLLTH
ncbi:unnamed protein product [Schistosoma rodhaini]|nr:unnamed protein product [Schistosoma rodhaini]